MESRWHQSLRWHQDGINYYEMPNGPLVYIFCFQMSMRTTPKLFKMRIIHSDGSSFLIRSTSPKSILQMTKDTLTSSVWNPKSEIIDDQMGELSKFKKRFGQLDLF